MRAFEVAGLTALRLEQRESAHAFEVEDCHASASTYSGDRARSQPGPHRGGRAGVFGGAGRRGEGEAFRSRGPASRRHTTDAEGHFAFEQVPFGRYRLVVTGADGRTDSQDVRLSAGEVVRAEVFLPVELGEVVVAVPKPKAPEPSKTSSSASTLERRTSRSCPVVIPPR